MQKPSDPHPFAILYVDDEEKSLRNFARAFGRQFRILTAASAQDGLALLQQHADEVGVLMTDQRMPGEKGVWLLEQARQLRPRVVRILVTAYADMEAAIEAVNSGSIYKYVTKPWDPPTLEMLLRRALEFFLLQRERDQLVTERLSMLQNLMVADRLLSLGLLAAGLSHHIRNALVAVKTFIDLAPSKLREEGVDPAEVRHPDFWRDYHASVQNQLDRINGMLKDLWLAAEKPAYEFRDVVQLRPVIEAACARFQAAFVARGITVDNQVPTDLPPIRVDHHRFSRLFELLLEDQLVSLPPGTRITVTATPVTDPGAEPSLRVEVQDNGPGLPPEVLRMVFDPFVVRTDSPSEYGIRLMACFFIVHQHGGRIIARSTEGRGTTFVMRLPLDPSKLPLAQENQQFLEKLFFNEEHYSRHLASG